MPKGDVLATARVAGIMAAKRTADLIPLCHGLALTGAEVTFSWDEEGSRLQIQASAHRRPYGRGDGGSSRRWRSPPFTVYDMCKAVDRGMRVTPFAWYARLEAAVARTAPSTPGPAGASHLHRLPPPVDGHRHHRGLSSHAIADPAEAGAGGPRLYDLRRRHPLRLRGVPAAGGKIDGGLDLSLREERLRPYLVGASNILGLLALVLLSAPQTVSLLLLAYATNSAHGRHHPALEDLRPRRRDGDALTALISAFGAGALPLAVIVPVVCWARVRAQMHTVAQVARGLAGVLHDLGRAGHPGPSLLPRPARR